MAQLLINLDVDDIERAIRFYTEGLDLRLGRRFDAGFVEMLGAEVPVYLLRKAAGTPPFARAQRLRGAAELRLRSRRLAPARTSGRRSRSSP